MPSKTRHSATLDDETLGAKDELRITRQTKKPLRVRQLGLSPLLMPSRRARDHRPGLLIVKRLPPLLKTLFPHFLLPHPLLLAHRLHLRRLPLVHRLSVHPGPIQWMPIPNQESQVSYVLLLLLVRAGWQRASEGRAPSTDCDENENGKQYQFVGIAKASWLRRNSRWLWGNPCCRWWQWPYVGILSITTNTH